MKFDISLLGLAMINSPSGIIAGNKPLKNVKKNAILFELFWYKVFVH